MKSLIASIRLVIVTMLVCVAGYTALILGFAQIVTPDTAEGSLIKEQGWENHRQPFDRAEFYERDLFLAATFRGGLQRRRGGWQQQITDQHQSDRARAGN